MSIFSKFKRIYQWQGGHYLEALLEQDMKKRNAIFSEFLMRIHKSGVSKKLINGREVEFEKYLIKQATANEKKTIYQFAEELAEELKAPK